MDISEKIEHAYRKHASFAVDGICYRVLGNYRIDGLKVMGFDRKFVVKPRVLKIPSSLGQIKVKEIAEGAFEGENIEKVILPYTIDIVQNRAFMNCCRLQTVTLKGCIVVLTAEVFANCPNLTKIDGYGQLFLWKNALHDCIGLHTIQPHIGTVHKDAFNGCSNLHKISLDDNANIDENAFRNSAIRVIQAFGQITIANDTIEFFADNDVTIEVSSNSNLIELLYHGLHVKSIGS